MEKYFDLYTDYPKSSFRHLSATGLSASLDDAIKHDSFTIYYRTPI